MSKISRIEISFPTPVTLPSGFDRALDALIDQVCKQYERDHPTEVMWPASYGSKMLSNPLAMSDEERIEFDDSIYTIGVCCRDDYYGDNPHNPDRERLQREARTKHG